MWRPSRDHDIWCRRSQQDVAALASDRYHFSHERSAYSPGNPGPRRAPTSGGRPVASEQTTVANSADRERPARCDRRRRRDSAPTARGVRTMPARTRRTREAKPCSSSTAPTGSTGVLSSKRTTTMTRVALGCHHPGWATVGLGCRHRTRPVGHAPGVHHAIPAVKIAGGPLPAHETWSGPERLVRAAGLPQSVRAGR